MAAMMIMAVVVMAAMMIMAVVVMAVRSGVMTARRIPNS